jgi:hypothetical protein
MLKYFLKSEEQDNAIKPDSVMPDLVNAPRVTKQ